MSLQIAFVGTGSYALKHAGMISAMNDVRVAAFCGTNIGKAEAAAGRWSGAAAYDNVEEMVERERPDAVYVCVPPMAHGAIEETLIERGIPFFVEKPLGVEASIPERLLSAVQHKRLITSVGYHWRYQDSTQRARELLKDCQAGLALGYFMGALPRVPWWRIQAGSGGQFVEQTTHVTDLLRYLCGEAVEVYAIYNHTVMHRKVEGVDVPDSGTVTLKLSNGMIATISNTCLLPMGHTSGLHLYTDQGVLELQGTELKVCRQSETHEYKNVTDPYLRENEAFLHALRTGDDSGILSSYEDAVRTHRISMAANDSAQTGQPVKLK
ncbi:Gfo/Idh/MocA family protein [Paenibacillus cremeus]|uniref:Gfo/Idh/MocA family oxidoreductase n=1 Tax=Paenibacillus cremeus TaxID=2163881 RepID=A0A559KGB6_9BACL|nr:Gfo/Idh/MocA family oxidoreductase [Paenibacillus cremeus]TVY11177.1 Gfo/Idh/MocA family oxidoreductase [Paenibacillus cremeus]